jgi:nucleoside-diphosphate-sugar epimerase
VRVPYGDLGRLEAELRAKDVAAFIVEPIQGRLVTLPPPGYLEAAQELCRRYGTLFVLDEIQTGLGRTGEWFALDHWGLEPDIVTVGKALSGGYMPVAAMVTRREIFQRAVGSLERSYVHQSTYGRNRLSMAAGLAAMRVIERDGLVGRSLQMGGLLVDGLRELQQRHELIKEVRGAGMMIGIELQAPHSRKAQLGVRLMRLASEGLFPQLIVIPLHRDHGVITMAAGKNDVIKLLPPLTLSEPEARTFLDAFDAVLSDCEGDSGKNWTVVRDIAVSTLRRREHEPSTAFASAAFSGKRVDLSQDNVCLVTGASGFIGGQLARRLVREGYQVRCLVRPTSDVSALTAGSASDAMAAPEVSEVSEVSEVEIVTGDLTAPQTLARAVEGCRYVFHCGAMVSDWGTAEEIQAVNVGGTRDLLEACARASVTRFVQLSSTDVYGYPGGADVDEGFVASGFRNWYAQTKRDAEAEVRRAGAAAGFETVILRPATVYGPGSREVVLEIARAIRGRRMLLIDQGRAVAGLCFIDNLLDAAVAAMVNESAAGQVFNVSDGLDVSWRAFADGLADGLGRPRPRLSLPVRWAELVGVSLEYSYRLLHRLTGITTRPLLSRQAVHVMGTDQSFSTLKAREMLGWEPRVSYAEGLAATLEWLRSEGV